MILITGAGGTCGRELLRLMTATGIPFRAGYSADAKAAAARLRGIDAVVADFRDPASLGPVMTGIDTLFLLAGWSPDQSEIEMNVVRASVRAGVRHIVKLSVWDAGGEEFSFARIHRPVERVIEESGVGWTFLRPNGFMQNLSNFSSATVRAQSTLFVPAVDAPVSHVDVRDVARVAAVALTRPGHQGRVYELSGPAPLTYREMASTLTRLLGHVVTCVEIGPDQLREQMETAGVPSAYVDAVNDLTLYYAAGHAARVSPDVKHVTGIDPTPFDVFARDHAAAFRSSAKPH